MVCKNNSTPDNPYIYYVCSGHKQKEGCKSSHSIRDKLLEQAVFIAVQEHIQAVLEIEDTLAQIARLPYTTREVKKLDGRIQKKRQEIEKYQRYKLKLHEDYSDQILSREDYISFGKRYDVKLKDSEETMLLLEKEIENLVNGNTDEQQWIAHFKQYQNISELTRKLAIALIERIFVYEGKRIYIRFQFQVEFDSAVALLENIGSLTNAPEIGVF